MDLEKCTRCGNSRAGFDELASRVGFDELDWLPYKKQKGEQNKAEIKFSLC